MKIDVKNEHVMYIEIDDYVFYIDYSTDEPIINKWHKYNEETDVDECPYCQIKNK